MTKLLLSILLTLFTLPAFAKGPIRSIDGVVSKISDGDTIHVTDSLGTKIKVRFYGIDCPETEKSNNRTGKISKQGQPYDHAYRNTGGVECKHRKRLTIFIAEEQHGFKRVQTRGCQALS